MLYLHDFEGVIIKHAVTSWPACDEPWKWLDLKKFWLL